MADNWSLSLIFYVYGIFIYINIFVEMYVLVSRFGSKQLYFMNMELD